MAVALRLRWLAGCSRCGGGRRAHARAGWFWRGRAVFVSKRFCCFRWGLGRVKWSDGLDVCAGQSVFGGWRVGVLVWWVAFSLVRAFSGGVFLDGLGWVCVRETIWARFLCVVFGRVGFCGCYYI